jgi:hypothetical protein
VLLEPKNLKTIMNAQNPHGMAHRIAEYRLIDLTRSKVLWKEWPVSQLRFGTNEDGEIMDDAERFDRIGFEQNQLEDRFEEQDRIRTFPGVTFFWTWSNVRQLAILAGEAMEHLPQKPFPWKDVVLMRSGASTRFGRKCWPWDMIARHFSPAGGKAISTDQVRYAFAKSAGEIRTHIMKHLTPDLGEKRV